MTAELNALLITAASIAFFHTLLGPDHYLPFIMMSWSRKWSTIKTTIITVLCGIGHVGSSVVLGLIGVALGVALKKLEIVESVRGDMAAWLLTAFGLVYLLWGLRQAYRNRPHEHRHLHISDDAHTHEHNHHDEHLHIHESEDGRPSIAPWTLFVIFVLGPCEPLIPILMYPAAHHSWFGLGVVTGVFGIITIATMIGTVMLAIAGVNFIPLKQVQRFTHALAGAAIFACGLAIVFLGL
jgi:nickel/cobalt transporter (NicO) family protein